MVLQIIGALAGIAAGRHTLAQEINKSKKVVQIINSSSIDRRVKICSGDDKWDVTIPKCALYQYSFRSHISMHLWLLDYVSGRNIPIFNEGTGTNQFEEHELEDDYVIISRTKNNAINKKDLN